MDLQADLEWIHKELENVKDPTFIDEIKSMLKKRKEISSERISIEQYNIEIEDSITEIKSGKTLTHQQVGEHIKQWAKQ